jgi:dihydroorotate dehydrogenase (NAD+) catalytic subunit
VTATLPQPERADATVQAAVGGPLAVRLAGLSFQNPIVLAAGTAGYGYEVAGVIDLDRLGGITTKAVSVEPRKGAPAPRVAEFPGGMINAVGLANPGLEAVRVRHLPWLAAHLRTARVLVNVVGFGTDEFATVVEGLDAESGVDGFELNVSCPNVKAGGMEFGADPAALRMVVERARRVTRKPLLVKLSPALPNVAEAARVAVDAGADALTLVNTLPGLVIDVERRRPALGFGTGGVSGPGLVPVGVLATWRVRQAIDVPVLGLGGVRTATDALQYILAGASAVGIGTAAMQDPRAPERIVGDLREWCDRHGVRSITDVVGTLEWPR